MDLNELISQGTFQRDYRVCTTPYSLNPAVAYAMNQLVGLDENDRVLDPCCGTGTILIERQLLKPAECFGVDINPKNLECAKQNIAAANVQITLKHGDIMDQKFPDQTFTKIISNLPFGIHSGSREKNKQLYRFLADQAINWLAPDGKAIFLTNAKSLLRNSFAFNESWQLEEEIPLKISNLNLAIFIFSKK